eukprot:39148-Eustigmatos_ZCMA.PRE.1
MWKKGESTIGLRSKSTSSFSGCANPLMQSTINLHYSGRSLHQLVICHLCLEEHVQISPCKGATPLG